MKYISIITLLIFVTKISAVHDQELKEIIIVSPENTRRAYTLLDYARNQDTAYQQKTAQTPDACPRIYPADKQ